MRIFDEWIEDIPQQFKNKKLIEVIIKAFSQQLQEVYDVFRQLDEETDLKTAVGKNLDMVGTIANLNRKEAHAIIRKSKNIEITDEVYRNILLYKVLMNNTDCTYDDIIDGMSLLWSPDNITYAELPERPATIFLILDRVGIDSIDPIVGRVLVIRPSGVSMIYVAQYGVEINTIETKDFNVRTIHRIRLSPFNAYIIARRDGKYKRDGTLTRAGYTVIPYRFPILNVNKAFLDNINMITPKVLFDFMLNNLSESNVGKVTYNISLSPFNSYTIKRDGKYKRDGTVTRYGYTGIKPYKLPVATTTTTALKNDNTIDNVTLTTKAPIKRNGRYKRDGTAYRDGKTARYTL